LKAAGKLRNDYSKASHLQECVTAVCLDGWIYQYTPLAGTFNPDIPNNAYDTGSIMHYPFDDCLAPKATPVARKPSTLGVTDFDASSVNERYGCYKVNVKYNRLSSKDVFIHPDLTLAEAQKDIATFLGFADWDPTWELQGVGKNAKITATPLVQYLKAQNLVNLCVKRSMVVNGC